MAKDREPSLLGQLTRLTGQVAGQTLDIAKNTATMSAMFGENWLKSVLMKTLEPERLDAMADAGRFLRDARETAGLSLKELTEALGLKDDELLADIESGERVMPLELLFRSASLIARHDPIPFLIKFMRTYNPALGETLEQWGILTLPMQYERERRWINLYRQHDVLRTLSDEEYDRLIKYVDSATNLVLDVMQKEKAANKVAVAPAAEKSSRKPADKKVPKVEVEAVAASRAPTRKKKTGAQKKARPKPAKPS
jgi:transcriptional regulator with XRE-family HTH domain